MFNFKIKTPKEQQQKLLEVINMFITLIVMRVTEVQIRQIVDITYVQFLKYKLHLNRVGNVLELKFIHLNEIWSLPKKYLGEPGT